MFATQNNNIFDPQANNMSVPQINNLFVPMGPLQNTNPPAPHSTQAAQNTNYMSKLKKSCTFCAGRKAKCETVVGSSPKLCTNCQKKGMTCTFEVKKEYGSGKA
jgi:hypothetical protein